MSVALQCYETYLTIILADFRGQKPRSSLQHIGHISDSLGYSGATLLNVTQYFICIVDKPELIPHVVLAL